MLRTIILLIAIFGASFTISAQETDNTATETIIHVAPITQPCVGVAPQDCLVVRFEEEDYLSFFYDAIEGFDFEAGYEYTLSVRITEIDNPPADASSLQYELIDVLQQFPADISNKLWELQTFDDRDIELASRYDLIILEDGMAIKADCNRVRADYELEPFRIETTISTLAMCAPDTIEGEYLQALNNAIMFSVENGTLLIQSPTGLLRFAPPIISDLTWQLETATRDDVAITPDDATFYTMQFVGEAVFMTVACNQAFAIASVDGAVMNLSEIETEEELCDNDLLAGLFPPIAFTYAVNSENQLILETVDGTRYTFNATVDE
ncbi:MAG: DUF4377 domain-containing protein [Phototrophicaceae bacterium]